MYEREVSRRYLAIPSSLRKRLSDVIEYKTAYALDAAEVHKRGNIKHSIVAIYGEYLKKKFIDPYAIELRAVAYGRPRKQQSKHELENATGF